MNKELIKEMRKAIKENQLDVIKSLVENNEGILEVVTIFGTFLHDASTYGMEDIVKYFIECGVDVNKKGGNRDSSALTIAAFKGYINIVELLYENGAELDISSFERNPLFAAIYNGHLEIVKFLIEKGIELDVYYAVGDLDKVDAYEYARQYGRTEIVNYIKENM